jgi:hypothetical protein
VALSGLLLLLFCWRELLRVIPALCILLCLAIGISPLIYYNLHALPGQDSLSILMGLQGHGNAHSPLLPHILSTFQVSIPTITGDPFCPVNESYVLRDPTSPHTLSCSILHGGWSAAYLALFACAILVAAWTAWQAWKARKDGPEARQNLARHTARLLLIGSATLALLLFVEGSAPLSTPANHARYIVGLLIATPALLWPLWLYARTITQKASRLPRIRSIASALALAVICILSLTGTIIVFQEIPTAQAYSQQDMALVTRLESMGITHTYGGYWTCDKLAFLSQEKVICGVVSGSLYPNHNRYQHYFDVVKSDPHTSYVFAYSEYRVVVEHWVEQNPAKYHLTIFEGWYIVQPV